MTDQVAIDVRGMTKRFGKRTVVRRIDLQVPTGEICGLKLPTSCAACATESQCQNDTAGYGAGFICNPATNRCVFLKRSAKPLKLLHCGKAVRGIFLFYSIRCRNCLNVKSVSEKGSDRETP